MRDSAITVGAQRNTCRVYRRRGLRGTYKRPRLDERRRLFITDPPEIGWLTLYFRAAFDRTPASPRSPSTAFPCHRPSTSGEHSWGSVHRRVNVGILPPMAFSDSKFHDHRTGPQRWTAATGRDLLTQTETHRRRKRRSLPRSHCSVRLACCLMRAVTFRRQ